ncbi:hypothetical protein FA15DRAFT_648643 [Coprinopsis marcescibilis]|uniref:CHAT domain-containing protein n=1 Tax=Coprinopsis marcescibilis TaxID=230819 RepID=A0A5C3KGE3_COPMA|nr:hypothetical protein FA15DRAFT_648643 [Coprinopsis marcescibilis]
MSSQEDGTVLSLSGHQEFSSVDVALQVITETVQTLKKNLKSLAIQDAIISLQQVIQREEVDSETRVAAKCYLVRALLTRFAYHGLVTDLDKCIECYFKDGLDVARSLEAFMARMRQGENNCAGDVDVASGLIEEYRHSIGTNDLNPAISLATSTLSACATKGASVTQLLIALGNAYVVRYMHQGEWSDLDEAVKSFHEAKSRCQGAENDPLMALAIQSLGHAGWVLFTECGKWEGIHEATKSVHDATEEDKEGMWAYHSGTKLLMVGDPNGIDDAVSFLRASLEKRKPGHPRRISTLGNLTVGLLSSFKQQGRIEDLDESISICRESIADMQPPHPGRYSVLNSLGNNLYARYEHQNSFNDLEECISIHREALTSLSSGHPSRSQSLNNLANALWLRFLRNDDLRDLESAIDMNIEALKLRPPNHEHRAQSFSNLANTLRSRFNRKGDPQDLDQCIAHQREAVALESKSSSSLFNLAGALQDRFEHKNNVEDLQESISLLRKVLKRVWPAPHTKRPSALQRLAGTLAARFLHSGNFEDLDEAIKLHRKVLKLQLPPHPDRHVSLNGLATELRIRFDHKGNSDDLERSIAYSREALSLQSPCHPHRCSSLAALGNALRTRFSHKGDIPDIEEAIQVQKEALISRPAPHPDRPDLLNDLATAFSARYDHSGDFKDLDESILLDREAISLRPMGHVNHAQSISNLANNLSIRFRLKAENFADLEESLMMHRKALSLRPVPDPERSQSLHNLSIALSDRFHHRGDIQDIQECVVLGEEALKLRPSPHPQRPQTFSSLAANRWTLYQHTKKNFEDLEQCISLNEEALAAVPEGHPGRFQFLHNLASSLLHLFERTGDLKDLNKSISLHRQVTSLLPTQHYQRPKALTGLSVALSLRLKHRKYTSTEDISESIALSEEALSLTPAHSHNYNECLATLASNLHIRFHDSGNNEDLERAHELWEKAAKTNTGPLLLRLGYAKTWAIANHLHSRKAAALEAYRYAIELLPLLASVDLTLDQRQGVLHNSKSLSSDAALSAILSGELQTAVVFLSTSRSIFWSQALQLRTPLAELEAVDKGLAESLRTISRQLEVETQGPIDYNLKISTSPSRTIDSLRLYSLSQEREKLLGRIREIDGMQNFMRPGSFDALKEASRNGPIVFLNASKLGCDAVIMRPGGQLERVPFLKINYKLLQELKGVVQNLAQGSDLQPEAADALEKLHSRGGDHDGSRKPTRNDPQNTVTVNDRFRQVLGILWVNIVKPVIDALGLQKTDEPPRLWWCPIGPFVFLPVHAAGIYSTKPSSWEADECLSDFAIASYCYSPQNLLSDTPKVPANFTMLAVLEPEGVEGTVRGLPMTEVELEKIQDRIPSPDHLITRLGSKASPNTTETILNDIQQSSFVHFGCHGVQHESNPLESSLLLSGGRLTMSRIMRECQQSSTACLAYLSACETAMGDEERPDESLNLAATMMFSGFKSVVGTMWSIKDEDAPIVADVFYGHLFRKGKASLPDPSDAAESLHLSVKELRRLGRDFKRWVPFVHFGI